MQDWQVDWRPHHSKIQDGYRWNAKLWILWNGRSQTNRWCYSGFTLYTPMPTAQGSLWPFAANGGKTPTVSVALTRCGGSGFFSTRQQWAQYSVMNQSEVRKTLHFKQVFDKLGKKNQKWTPTKKLVVVVVIETELKFYLIPNPIWALFSKELCLNLGTVSFKGLCILRHRLPGSQKLIRAFSSAPPTLTSPAKCHCHLATLTL